MRRKEMLIYRNFPGQEIFDGMRDIIECGYRENVYQTLNSLIELANLHGFEGNVWHFFLAYVLANHENAFSTSCEIRGHVEGSINDIALQDFRIFRKLFAYDLDQLDAELGMNVFRVLKNYQSVSGTSKVFNQRIRDRIESLSVHLAAAANEQEFMDHIVQFYKEFGVGKFGLHKAFKVENIGGDVQILPITKTEHTRLSDLIGYELQKKQLIENTEAFVRGQKANNCLLFGDAGTGKSTSIKAILNQYYGDGLRMIEIYKHQFKYLSAIISHIKNRNYRFIIYMDDLSFEEFEIEYKYLKAVIEGGMETKPDNVLIYATSNRRHLIRETWSDRSDKDEELHRSDTVQEKLSLAARFGVSINYSKPTQQEYFQIVTNLAKKYPEIKLSDKELCAEANKWELSHGGISGRTAQQFINYIAGKSEK